MHVIRHHHPGKRLREVLGLRQAQLGDDQPCQLQINKEWQPILDDCSQCINTPGFRKPAQAKMYGVGLSMSMTSDMSSQR